MIIPKSYGGLEFSASAHSAVLQKLMSISSTLASTVAVPNSLGPAELIHRYGTTQQKDYYLPRLAVGTEVPCFALTAPTAGSDATSIPDTGIVCRGNYKGEEVLGLKLTFDKRYITLAPVATVVGLAFQMHDPDQLLGETRDHGITLALLPHDTDGLEIGRRHHPLDIPFQNGPVRGRDVFVPLDAIIGGPKMAGEGWRMLVECLSVGRAISLPSNATGACKTAAFSSGAYARIRRQFNLPIGRFEGVEEALARVGGHTYAVSALSRATAAAVDRGERPSVPSAIAKYHATEVGRKIITDAMDIHGGKGIVLGPRNYLGRFWQGSPISITVEGANILTRSMMIYGQGAVRCHPSVLKEMEAAGLSDPVDRLNRFDEALFDHVGFALSNAVRSLLLGLSGGRLASVPQIRGTRRYYRQLTRYSAALAFASDIAMLTLGGKLKRKEKLSARLGDVLSQLYICSAMLKRYEDQGRPTVDLPLLKWACYDSVYQMQQALDGFLRNYPTRAVGWLLRLFIFPLGTRSVQPSDRLGHKVSTLLLSPSATRQRLTDGIYKTPTKNNQVGMMDEILHQVIAAEPVERRLRKALRNGVLAEGSPDAVIDQAVEDALISKEEASLVRLARQATLEVIAVDDFDPEELQRQRPKQRSANKVREQRAA